MVDDDLSRERERHAAVVQASPQRMVLIDLPEEKILATSPAARAVLPLQGDDLVGRSLRDFTQGVSAPGMELLRAGRLLGFEAVQQLTGADDTEYRIWVQTLGSATPAQLAVAVLVDAEAESTFATEGDEAVVAGSADAELKITRVTTTGGSVLGQPSDDLLGRSLLSLVDDRDVAALLGALAQSLVPGRGGTVRVRCHGRDGTLVRTVMLLLPTQPAPSCTFAIVPDHAHNGRGSGVEDGLDVGQRAVRAFHDVASGTFEGSPLQVEGLTNRERAIVGLLLAGDRVPAIARRLFVSQSTVRNHLSAIFRKAGVGSQQELIDLARGGDRV
jgi:DNA-binding CsgD family transcriptional regulator